jgi:hypothetical protein
MSLKSREERYMEWLERTEEYLEDMGIDSATIVDFSDWRKLLAEELGYTESQIEALWEMHEYSWEELAKYGIRHVVYVYRTGPRAGQREVRYVIKGQPGLWSWEHAKLWYEKFVAGEE